MRTFGILAFFVLGLLAVGQAGYMFKLRGQVTDLAKEVQALRETPQEPPSPVRTFEGVTRTTPRPLPQRDLPVFTPPPSPAAHAGSAGAPPLALREAFATAEGRKELAQAIENVFEMQRQEKFTKWADKREQRDAKLREVAPRELALNPDEERRFHELVATVQNGRRQSIEDMRTGLKTHNQARDELENVEDQVEKGLKALLGDKRQRQFRDINRREERKLDGKEPEPPRPEGKQRENRGGAPAPGQTPGQPTAAGQPPTPQATTASAK